MSIHARLRLTPVAVCVLLSACGDHSVPDPRVDQPPLVSTALVQADAALRERRFTGVIAARVESSLGFRVSGKIAKRFVDVGQSVKRGDPLMQLDTSDFSLDVQNQQANVDSAHASMVKADADLARVQGLVELGAVSARTFDQTQETQRSARANWEAAKAKLELSRNAYGYAILRADADGVVVERFADNGQVVAAGQPVVVLAQDGPREARIDLPETLRPALGSRVTARLYGNPEQAFGAQLRELSGSADPVTRTFRARYVLDGNSRTIPLGSTVVIGIDKPNASSEREIPLGALYDRGQGPGVWVVSPENKVQYRAVKLARIDEEVAIVNAGLESGERVVALGAHQLHDDQQVRVMEGPAQ
ncbi:efflux RND transporter periplasmic adaptor subunit [Pseudomonas sp. LA21]|uniref:efflux RND transporter periplasmic adaptor subunit n=1 Tax=Pseudomonas sp. LA21 TaxID=2893373 RepID=UPI001FB6415E|nr:efflux RND transporter periplasmic adaptor subunit [Pseudomonas sp. LA21]MCJ1887466.1 efflux RND transporter periplasmic adaptor subunit [Pseudomonas sp. LA21]